MLVCLFLGSTVRTAGPVDEIVVGGEAVGQTTRADGPCDPAQFASTRRQ